MKRFVFAILLIAASAVAGYGFAKYAMPNKYSSAWNAATGSATVSKMYLGSTIVWEPGVFVENDPPMQAATPYQPGDLVEWTGEPFTTSNGKLVEAGDFIVRTEGPAVETLERVVVKREDGTMLTWWYVDEFDASPPTPGRSGLWNMTLSFGSNLDSTDSQIPSRRPEGGD